MVGWALLGFRVLSRTWAVGFPNRNPATVGLTDGDENLQGMGLIVSPAESTQRVHLWRPYSQSRFDRRET